MPAPAIINLSPCVYLDTWDGLTGCSFTSDGTAFASPLSRVRMYFMDANGSVGKQCDSEDETITITDAAAWEFDVAPFLMQLAAGEWQWSIETTDSSGDVKTRVTGTIRILSDATQ